MDENSRFNVEYEQINQLYDECLLYLKNVNTKSDLKPLLMDHDEEQNYEAINKGLVDYRHEIITDTILEEPDNETIDDKRDNHGVTIIEVNKNENDAEYVVKVNVESKLKKKVDPDYENVNSNIQSESESVDNESEHSSNEVEDTITDPGYEKIKPKGNDANNEAYSEQNVRFNVENELSSATGSVASLPADLKSERLRRLSEQLPKIIITQSNTSLSLQRNEEFLKPKERPGPEKRRPVPNRYVLCDLLTSLEEVKLLTDNSYLVKFYIDL